MLLHHCCYMFTLLGIFSKAFVMRGVGVKTPPGHFPTLIRPHWIFLVKLICNNDTTAVMWMQKNVFGAYALFTLIKIVWVSLSPGWWPKVGWLIKKNEEKNLINPWFEGRERFPNLGFQICCKIVIYWAYVCQPIQCHSMYFRKSLFRKFRKNQD